MTKALNNITTLWSTMDQITLEGGPQALMKYIYARYTDPLVTYLLKKGFSYNEAEDIAAEILFEFIKNSYNLVNKLDREQKLRGLIFSIMRNKISQHYRKNFKEVAGLAEIEKTITQHTCELQLDVSEALVRLQKENRYLHQICVLRFIEGKRIHEIADEVQVSRATVYNRLSHAKEWLTMYLDSYKEKS